MKIKYAVVFNYNRTGNLRYDGTAAILIRAYLNRRNKFFNTGIYIQPNQWSGKHANATWIKNHPNQFHINKSIRTTLDKMQTLEFEVLATGEDISLERLADFESKNLKISFTEFCNQQLEQSKLTITRSSYTDQRQTINKLKEFQNIIYFGQLSFKLVNGFDRFLFSIGLKINTVAKHHKNLKKFINLACKHDYLSLDNNPYKKFKIKREATERDFLMPQELEVIENLKIQSEKNHLRLTRDMFLFMCYTGLRFSDANQLNGNSFHESPEGLILTLIAQKNKKPHRLNLRKLFAGKPEKIAKSYLKKYDEYYFDDPDSPKPFFLGLTNQTINKKLKVIVRDSNIRQELKESISCHCGRHTFGTIMATKVKIPILQKLMQHSKLKETQIYLHLSQSMIDDALDNVEW